MDGLTLEEKRIAYQCALNGADFMFFASPELYEKIIHGCPETAGISSVLISIILQKKAIRLDTETVKKYCTGILDKKNTWLFDNGNIKVVPSQLKKLVKLKPNEDITKKEENNDE